VAFSGTLAVMAPHRLATLVRCQACGLSFTTSDAPRAVRVSRPCAFCGDGPLVVVPASPRFHRGDEADMRAAVPPGRGLAL
jgi:hypothetical protein